jgi:hypothetical protein
MRRGALLRVPLVCAGVLALGLLGGAGRSTASTTPQCSVPEPTGREFCVTIEDQEGVSPSGLLGAGKRQVELTAYQYYKFSIENKGGSTLTNGTLKATLKDQVGTQELNSTALYVAAASASFCSLTSTDPNTVSCSLPNIAAGPQALVFYLVYRTSTTAGVTGTNLAGLVGFKEGSNGPNGANPATFPVSEQTSLEGDPEASVAWSPPSSNVVLGTSPTFDTQFSTLAYTVPAGKSAFLARQSEGTGSVPCPTGLTCFGEVITTDLSGAADGTFSSSNPFHLTITISLDAVPGGNVDNVALVHVRDNTTVEIIRTRCSSSPPAGSDTLPCITVTKDNKAKLLIIDAWGYQNGGWVPGL